MSKLIAVIMGNGPSLNLMPPSAARDFDTYGCNYAKYQPKFYVCIDRTILRECPQDIYQLAKNAETAYLSDYDKECPNPQTYRLYSLPNVELVRGETHTNGAFRSEDWMTGGTATYVALKLAYYAGYDEVWLWGVDHSKDWTHYDPNYPDDHLLSETERDYHMKMMLRHYWLAQRVYSNAGRRIVNFSNPSPLDSIFDREGLEYAEETSERLQNRV